MIEPDDPPGCEGLERVRIGEDVSERLDVTPAQFRVIVTRRPKYVYKGRDGVIQAAAPPRIIESGIPTEALLAQIAVAKYADGLPLYRQEAIYARDKVVHRALADGAVDGQGRVRARAPGRACPGADQAGRADLCRRDNPADPGARAQARPRPHICGPMCAMIGRLAAAIRRSWSTASRTAGPATCVARHLEGYRGILQVDGYTAYHRLARPEGANEGVQLAACWSHVRRKFYELHVSDASVVAGQTLEQMAALWALEDSVRGKTAMTRMKARQAELGCCRERRSSRCGRRSCQSCRASRSSPRRSAML